MRQGYDPRIHRSSSRRPRVEDPFVPTPVSHGFALPLVACVLLAFSLLHPGSMEAEATGDASAHVDPALRSLLDTDAGSALRIVLLHGDPSPHTVSTQRGGPGPVSASALRRRAAAARRGAEPLLAELARSGSLRPVHQHWIVPATVVEATPGAIERLMREATGIRAFLLDEGQQILRFDGLTAGAGAADGGTAEASAPNGASETSLAPITMNYPWGISAIGAPDVWANFDIDGSGVLIAHIDTGVDYHHPDLAGHIWHNPGEIPGNRIDDDDNGLVDDVLGYDFALDTGDPLDDVGHGTHTAGSIVGDGTGGTATGVAPGATLMPLKVLSNGFGYESDCWAALEYALDMGADLVTMSLGWMACYHDPTREIWRAAVDAITSAGVPVIVAAGNEGDDYQMPWYCPPPYNLRTPADVPSALSIGACDLAEKIGSFSAVGPCTWEGVSGYDDYPLPPGLPKPDLAAPGVGIISTTLGGGYSDPDWNGTSMACPHVAGTVALMLSAAPQLTPEELRRILIASALDIEDPGFDVLSGAGLIDAFGAVQLAIGSGGLSVVGTGDGKGDGPEGQEPAVPGAAAPPRAILSFTPSPNPFHPETVLRFRLSAATRVRLGVYDARGRLVARLTEGWLPAGEHALRWDGRTPAGEQAPAGVYWARLETGREQAVRTLVLTQ